jgi:hypothetical protein
MEQHTMPSSYKSPQRAALEKKTKLKLLKNNGFQYFMIIKFAKKTFIYCKNGRF